MFKNTSDNVRKWCKVSGRTAARLVFLPLFFCAICLALFFSATYAGIGTAANASTVFADETSLNDGDIFTYGEGTNGNSYLSEDEARLNGGGVFAGGAGTEESPYLIATEGQLNSVRDFLNGYESEQGNKEYCFKLVADITLTGDWTPIGGMDWEADREDVFGGVFDGGGHTISGLSIDGGESGYDVGLFYGLNGARIRNLTVVTTEEGVRGHKNVGIIAGHMLHGEISGVRVAGRVAGAQQVGGIVGEIIEAPSKVSNCLMEAEVVGMGSVYVGGIAGMASGAAMTYCIVSGNLTGAATGFDGGTTEHYYMGGIVGYGEEVTLTRCLFSGKIIGDTHDSGGIVGEIAGFKGTSAVASVYYNLDRNPLYGGCGNISGYPDFTFPETGRTGAQLADTATFIDWDFEKVCALTPEGNITLRAFYGEPPKKLTWLYVALAAIAVIVAAAATTFFLVTKNKRKFSPASDARGAGEGAAAYDPNAINAAAGRLLLPETVSPREREVAGQIFRGKSRKEIAAELFITDGTVKNHIESLLKKTGCASQKELIVKYRME